MLPHFSLENLLDLDTRIFPTQVPFYLSELMRCIEVCS